MSGPDPRFVVWLTYLRRHWEEREADADRAWDILKKQGVAAVLSFMDERGMPASTEGFDPPPAKPERKRKHSTRRQIEAAIHLASREITFEDDGRLSIIMDSLPHPIYRAYRTAEERAAAKARIVALHTSAADLIAVRGDGTLYEFRYALAGSDTPKLPSARRLARAAATLCEAAACLQYRFDQRTEGEGE